jgi:hypothetical protein
MAAPAVPTLPIQPMPVGLILGYVPAENPTHTAILRQHAPGAAKFCRLCPRDRCTYIVGDSCLVVAPEVVAPGDAALYRLSG